MLAKNIDRKGCVYTQKHTHRGQYLHQQDINLIVASFDRSS